MGHPAKVLYKGKTYRLQSSGRYYISDSHTDSERLLHRRMWSDANGPIPEGHDIHHENGEWSDNRIENLELVVRREHQAAHMRERCANEPELHPVLTGAVEAAREWHGSDAGKQWHSEHGKRTWEVREPHDATCTICASTYQTFFPARSRFCSHACEQKEGYQRHKTATASCALCGKQFVFNRYRKQECCSRVCANRRRAQVQ